MPIVIVSEKSKEVYIGDSENPESLVRMVKSRLRRDQYSKGKYWWVQDRFNKYGGEGIELLVSEEFSDDLIGNYSSGGYKVYTDMNYPMPPKVMKVIEEDVVSRDNYFVPEEYQSVVGGVVMLLDAGEYEPKILRLNPEYIKQYQKVEGLMDSGVSVSKMDNYLNQIQSEL